MSDASRLDGEMWLKGLKEVKFSAPSSPSIGAELCRVLGLDRVMSLSIECAADNVAVITVRQFLSREQEVELIGVLRKFNVTEADGSPASIPLTRIHPASLEKQYQPD